MLTVLNGTERKDLPVWNAEIISYTKHLGHKAHRIHLYTDLSSRGTSVDDSAQCGFSI